MSKIVDLTDGREEGTGEVKEGSRKRGQRLSSVSGRHLFRENDMK